ncbi:hypothetical protein EPUS_07899 [Endocarpon pusillum Z07020]|uniref:Uncharacterized protein n=1 Tax=Endocarpon pusillum (strain Z07020 / HMAS-L-300199) TaxID=1263415 RepID=U1GHF1_ENDPU|nr:uncharacterized protein EPUS_07899 [Endocarpon pusillum Z07020]ERF71216.1 hypothetical protein EPUS_07899 [Endocarpon pusillum Z07020]
MSPSEQKAQILERAVLRLATQFEIQNHINNDLCTALGNEKKRRRRGVRLNLLGQESSSEPQFFSPTKVLAAKEYQDSKEAREQEELRQKALEKEENARRRAELAQQRQDNALQRVMLKQAAREEKEAQKAKKAAEMKEKRIDQVLKKQAKELAANERKKEAAKRKLDAAAAAATRTALVARKQASQNASVRRRSVVIRPKKVVFRHNRSTPVGQSAENQEDRTDQAVNVAGAEVAQKQTRSGRSVNPNKPSTNNIPIIVIGVIVAAIPSYYFINSNKTPAFRQSKIREALNKGDPSNEYREPRDNDVKTLEDKKRKQGN